MIGIVYFFGGVAKLNADWLRAQPILTSLLNTGIEHKIGLDNVVTMAYFFSYSSLFFDLLIVPFLLWKKTRIPAFVIAVIFHVMNMFFFTIGIFPWLMIFATLIFFDPSWPRKLINYIRKTKSTEKLQNYGISNNENTKKIITILFISFLVLNIAVPLRHHFYPGNVSWTEDASKFSWMMKLRLKTLENASFYAYDPVTDQRWNVTSDDLFQRQKSVVDK